MPGTYTARLTVDGAVQTQPLTVRMDPRVKTPRAALQRQHDLSVALYDAMLAAPKLETEARAKGLQDFVGPQGFGAIAAAHQAAMSALQGSDAPPTDAMVQAATVRLRAWEQLMTRWRSATNN
jgi:hypothetical protein